jgi:hypothetical protein
MKFILVNGRTPRPQACCTWCCEPIGESYLREFTTRVSYCGYRCYLDHCTSTSRGLRRAQTTQRNSIKGNRSLMLIAPLVLPANPAHPDVKRTRSAAHEDVR